MVSIRIGVTDATTPEDLDQRLTASWEKCSCTDDKIDFVFDITQCRHVSLRRMLGIRSVLNKHRSNSLAYINHSTIIAPNSTARNILRIGLAMIRTARPVKVITP